MQTLAYHYGFYFYLEKGVATTHGNSFTSSACNLRFQTCIRSLISLSSVIDFLYIFYIFRTTRGAWPSSYFFPSSREKISQPEMWCNISWVVGWCKNSTSKQYLVALQNHLSYRNGSALCKMDVLRWSVCCSTKCPHSHKSNKFLQRWETYFMGGMSTLV